MQLVSYPFPGKVNAVALPPHLPDGLSGGLSRTPPFISGANSVKVRSSGESRRAIGPSFENIKPRSGGSGNARPRSHPSKFGFIASITERITADDILLPFNGE
jgi:hypothetical protein